MALDSLRIAAIVKKARWELGLSQVQFATEASISLPTLQKIEAGAGNPSLSTVLAMFSVAGAELESHSIRFDWDDLASCGAPLTARPGGAVIIPSPTAERLRRSLIGACRELESRD